MPAFWARGLLRDIALLSALSIAHSPAHAGSGPFGIDSVTPYRSSGPWKRSTQQILVNGMIGVVLIGALMEGGEGRLRKTLWTDVDAGVVSGIAATGLKYAFSRLRPSQTNDPNQWFKGNGRSFPSGEVTTVSALVTPFVLEYRADHPAVYALELLPLYDAVARVKIRGHWQSDVIAGFALGTASAYFMRKRSSPLILSVMPHAIQVGFVRRF